MAFQEFSKKLLKYFNDTDISTFSVFPSLGAFPVILNLNLNHSEFIILSFGSFL